MFTRSDFFLVLHDHGTAKIDEEIESLSVREKGVPNTEHVRQGKFLAEWKKEKLQLIQFPVILVYLQSMHHFMTKKTIVELCQLFKVAKISGAN